MNSFFDAARDPMCILDRRGFIQSANAAFSATFGYERTDLAGMRLKQILFDEDVPLWESEQSIIDVRVVSRTGESKWMSLSRSPMDGRILCVAHDIEHLKRSEFSFKESFENAGVGIAHATFEGRILELNQDLCQLLGYERDELLKKNYMELFALSDLPTPEGQRLAIQRGEIAKFARERQMSRKDGTTIWILLTTTAVRDTRGIARYFILAHKDITVRKSIEETFRALVEAIPQIVWTATPDGSFEFYNQRWYDFTGLRQEESIGDGWLRVLHPHDLKRCTETWAAAIEKGESYETEYRIRDARSGTYRWQLARALPLAGNDGKIIRWFGTYTDIDDQKQTQQQLRQSLAELKRSSEERTRLLANEKAAVEASRLKSEFLATMTHEIRTPLNGVIAMAGLLRDTPLSEHQVEYAETIAQSAESLRNIVNDILDLSKIEAGKFDMEVLDFDIVSLMESVIRIMEPSARSKNVAIKATISDDVPAVVRGDPSRLRQIVFNLIHNAVKFTDSGLVELLLAPKPEDPSVLRFEVRDTGVGIDPAVLGRIWASFEQADASITRKYGGTGLGLSICKRLVEMMGGVIGVESEPAHGALFWFELSFALGNRENIGRAREAVAPSANRLRILVAEDHSINQKVIRRVIETLGHHVDVVADGEEALVALQQAPYDLIVMDCHMPRMDGYTATRAIRRLPDPKLSKIPVIALTADVLRGTPERCLAAGMNYFTSKPIEFSEIKAAIDAAAADVRNCANGAGSDIKTVISMRAIDIIRTANMPGMPDLAREVIADFVRTAPGQVKRILSHFELRQVENLTRESHTLKSVAATLGAMRLADICERIERMSVEGDMQEILPLVKDLPVALEEAMRALSTIGSAA